MNAEDDRRQPPAPRITQENGSGELEQKSLAFVATWRGMAAIVGVTVAITITAVLTFVDVVNLPERVAANESSVGTLRDQYEVLEDKMDDLIRLQAWQVCSRVPRPGPDVLAALGVECRFPAAATDAGRGG